MALMHYKHTVQRQQQHRATSTQCHIHIHAWRRIRTLEVGLLMGKMIGCSLMRPIASRTSMVNRRPAPARPMRMVGFTCMGHCEPQDMGQREPQDMGHSSQHLKRERCGNVGNRVWAAYVLKHYGMLLWSMIEFRLWSMNGYTVVNDQSVDHRPHPVPSPQQPRGSRPRGAPLKLASET